mgnify:CR=1 FL=1
MKKRANLLTKIVLLSHLLISCSTGPNRGQAPETLLCAGKNPTRKYVWTISFYQGFQKGMPIADVSKFSTARSELEGNVSKYFVGALLYLNSNNGHYSVRSSSLKNQALQIHASYIVGKGLIETGPSNFVFCILDDCTGLKDPVTGATIKLANEKGPYSNKILNKMYFVENIIDPTDTKYVDYRLTGARSNPAYIDWSDYFDRHPFPGSMFLINNYFSVPEMQKTQVCEESGLNKDCFTYPKSSDISNYCQDN